ncbi:MAG: helix-turn-helix domain-containing protein [bacterium]
MEKEQYYKIKEVAEILKVAYLTVYRWVKDGKIEAYQLGKEYRIKKVDLDRFVESSKYITKR